MNVKYGQNVSKGCVIMIDESRFLYVFRNLDYALRSLLDARAELEYMLELKGICLDIPSFPDYRDFEDPLFFEDPPFRKDPSFEEDSL